MSHQQINLYQPIFKRQEKIFSAVTMLQAGLLFTAGLCAVWGFTWWQGSSMASQLRSAQHQHNSNLARLAELTNTYPKRQHDPALTHQLEVLRAKRLKRQQLVGGLQGERLGNRDGFSRHMLALSRKDLDSLWLQRIRLSEGGGQIALQGQALEARSIPLFLQGLGSESVFATTTFESLVALRSIDAESEGVKISSPYVDFSLNSRLDNSRGAR